jgi:hypothetical protein
MRIFLTGNRSLSAPAASVPSEVTEGVSRYVVCLLRMETRLTPLWFVPGRPEGSSGQPPLPSPTIIIELPV